MLGSSNAWAGPGGTTSGYLVRTAEARVLVDCGHGVLARLRSVDDPFALDAVVLSHLHADHCADLIALAFMLSYHPFTGDERPRPRLIVPAGEVAGLEAIERAFGHEQAYAKAFAIEELAPDEAATVGDLTVTGAWVPHPRPTLALDVRADGGCRFTYSGDCGPNGALPALAAGTPLLVCEATLPVTTEDHLSAAEAGKIAAAASAERLLLTHVCDAYAPGWLAMRAREHFNGPVEIAEPGMTVELRRDPPR